MAERTIEFGQFALHPKSSKSTCKIFVSESEKDKNFGKFFGLIEIESPQSKSNYQILEKLAAEIENIYFRTAEAEIRRSKLQSDSPLNFESIFEHALQKINQVFFEINNRLFLSQISFEPKIKASGKINAALMLMQDNNLYLAQSGRIFSFLIYQNKFNDYKIINVLENSVGQEAKNNKHGTSFFSNILSGQVDLNNFFVLCTESVLDYLSQDKLKKTIAGNHPEEASSLIKNLLNEVESSSSFAALIIRPRLKIEPLPASVTAQTPSEKVRPLESLNQLIDTESKTEKFLTPSLKLNFQKYFSNILARLNFLKPKKGNKNLKNKIILVIKLVIYFPIIFIGKFLYFIFKIIFKSILLVFYLITKQTEKRKKITQEISQKIDQPLNKTINWFNALPRQSKIFLLIALIFIILFAQSVIFLNRKYKNETGVETYNVAVETIQNKKNEAEASLIYNDEEKARQILFEAKDLTEKLPQDSQKRKETKNNLLSEIQVLLLKLQHIVDISDPILIANLSDQNEQQISTHGLFAADKYLYTFNPSNNLIYKINTENKEVKILDSTLPASSHLELGTQKDKNSILFYHSGGGLFEFNLEDQTGKMVEITLGSNEQEIKDMTVYNQKIYLLDAKNNQIWKHSPTTSGYTRGTSWLKENFDLTSASSMAIDGTIYLIKNDGELLRLAGGYKENFETNIDPALTSPTKIWTSAETNYIYILEPKTKRLVVLDKNGKLKIQYRSDQFDDAKDFIVSEKEKKIYLLCGDKIYGIAANHL
jgi:hypothetical protein